MMEYFVEISKFDLMEKIKVHNTEHRIVDENRFNSAFYTTATSESITRRKSTKREYPLKNT